jgi:hypothetical protein
MANESTWPTRIESAATAASVLNEAYLLIELGHLDPPAEDAVEVRRVLGSKSSNPSSVEGEDPTAPGIFGGPTWPRRCVLPWGTPSSTAPDMPPMLWIVDAIVSRLAGGGIWLRRRDEDPSTSAVWVRQVTNGPRSAERDLVGVIGPPYAPTPSGAFSAALAVMVARDMSTRGDLYAAEISEARTANAFRGEASDLRRFADQVEALIAPSCASWLPLLRASLPRDAASRRRASQGAPPPIVPASLRVQ